MAEKKSLREHVIFTAVGTLVALAVGGVVAVSTPPIRRWMLTVPTMLSKLGVWLAEPMAVTRWHYWAMIMFLILFAGVVLVALASAALGTQVPSFLTYTEDQFFGTTWRWSWDGNRIDTDSIRPYCPICDRGMVFDHQPYDPATRLHCTSCQESIPLRGDIENVLGMVIREIDVNVRTERYPNVKVKGNA